MSPIVTLRSPLPNFLSNIIHPSRSPDQPRIPGHPAQRPSHATCSSGGLATHREHNELAAPSTGRHGHIQAGSRQLATTGRSARNITFALVEAPVTLTETRHECQRRGAEPAGGRGGCTVTRPVGVPRLVPLVCRRHVDLLRVSSAMCRFCR